MDFRDGLFSVFVDNLHPQADLVCLWGVFKAFGKVRDVLLSPKTSSRRSRFAFIRFKTLEEAARIAKTVNGMNNHGEQEAIYKRGLQNTNNCSYTEVDALNNLQEKVGVDMSSKLVICKPSFPAPRQFERALGSEKISGQEASKAVQDPRISVQRKSSGLLRDECVRKRAKGQVRGPLGSSISVDLNISPGGSSSDELPQASELVTVQLGVAESNSAFDSPPVATIKRQGRKKVCSSKTHCMRTRNSKNNVSKILQLGEKEEQEASRKNT
ncbi:hypothetical protein Dsin_013528 [Dipteronia sinensis]|uniref:RRM domain-containing protein n=1 Tax=Dipteronia sinensis TaxID=43782 RepID=A0AAE0AKN1_9ROSI|nr:hypothetical protein Dsin_013528 [Dipteronia sinensis]